MATTIENPEQFFKLIEEQDAEKRTELKNYLKVIKNNSQRLMAITSIGKRTHSPIPDEVTYHYLNIIIDLMLSGVTKINGKKGNWSVGNMGSRWLDWNAVDSKTTCRVSFLSKKYSKNWQHDTPYALLFDFQSYN